MRTQLEGDIQGTIFDIRKYSVNDGPGIRTTVFFKGCPLRCWWCHNPESQSVAPELVVRESRCIHCGACVAKCPQNAIQWEGDHPCTDSERCTQCGECIEACTTQAREMAGREMTVAQVMAEIERDLPFYEESGGGVSFSGGEPLQQSRFLQALLRACRQHEIHTVLDTCGYAAWEVLDCLREDVDLFLYDLKLVDDARHQQYTGVSNRLILSNLQKLAQHRHAIILRVPIIPGVNDDIENLSQIAALVQSLPVLVQVALLPYHTIAVGKYKRMNRTYRLPEVQTPSAERMAEVAAIFEHVEIPVLIGG